MRDGVSDYVQSLVGSRYGCPSCDDGMIEAAWLEEDGRMQFRLSHDEACPHHPYNAGDAG